MEKQNKKLVKMVKKAQSSQGSGNAADQLKDEIEVLYKSPSDKLFRKLVGHFKELFDILKALSDGGIDISELTQVEWDKNISHALKKVFVPGEGNITIKMCECSDRITGVKRKNDAGYPPFCFIVYFPRYIENRVLVTCDYKEYYERSTFDQNNTNSIYVNVNDLDKSQTDRVDYRHVREIENIFDYHFVRDFKKFLNQLYSHRIRINHSNCRYYKNKLKYLQKNI